MERRASSPVDCGSAAYSTTSLVETKANKEGVFSSRGKHEAQTVRHPDRVDVAGSATHRFTLRAGLGPTPGAHGHALRRERAAEWLDAARDLSLFRTRPHCVRVDHLHHYHGDPAETESGTRHCLVRTAGLFLFHDGLHLLREQQHY